MEDQIVTMTMDPDCGFLHRHPRLEDVLGVDTNHVIVDFPDWKSTRTGTGISQESAWELYEACKMALTLIPDDFNARTDAQQIVCSRLIAAIHNAEEDHDAKKED